MSVPSYVTTDGVTVKLTATSSMPCRSWSLPAEKSCPASKASVRKLGDSAVCGSCYAMAGFYRMSNVKHAQASRFRQTATVGPVRSSRKGTGARRGPHENDMAD